MKNMKVVFIGADSKVAEMTTLSIRLRWPDVTPLVAASALEGLELVDQMSPDVIVIHPNFDDLSLAKTIQEIRRFSLTPLLVLGHQGDDIEVITSLELGADDYIRLPCDLTELMVRIWALLRRIGILTLHNENSFLTCGQLFINPITHQVILNGEPISLTYTEFRMLHLLVRNRGAVVDRQILESTLWGNEVDSSGLVKKYVQRLRRKLGDDAQDPRWIASVHGVGYRFVGPAFSSRKAIEPSQGDSRATSAVDSGL